MTDQERQTKPSSGNARKINDIDYKDVDFLSKFTASTGKILPRQITGVGARYQRRVAHAIKLARFLSLLPYTENHRPFTEPPATHDRRFS